MLEETPNASHSKFSFDGARPLTLRIYPDSVLRETCGPVEHFDSTLADVVDEMLALMRCHEGVGLAGPQVGLKQRLFVAEVAKQPLVLVNPVIEHGTGHASMDEGCLSLAGVEVQVTRSHAIRINGYDCKGQEHRLYLSGLWARIAQHEIDHLNGVLIIDYQASARTGKGTH